MGEEDTTQQDETTEAPPAGYEPQVEQTPQSPEVYESSGDLVTDADAQPQDTEESGDADDADDEANDDEANDDEDSAA